MSDRLEFNFYGEKEGMYVFDIDGTIANLDHRLHYLDKPDWNSFYNECYKDEVITDIMEMLDTIVNAGYRILFMTGRPEATRDMTENWLDDNLPKYRGEIPYTHLFMRPDGDHRPDHVIKKEWMEDWLRVNPDKEIIGVFEDRQSVVDMWRDHFGFTVLQVAKGDF